MTSSPVVTKNSSPVADVSVGLYSPDLSARVHLQASGIGHAASFEHHRYLAVAMEKEEGKKGNTYHNYRFATY